MHFLVNSTIMCSDLQSKYLDFKTWYFCGFFSSHGNCVGRDRLLQGYIHWEKKELCNWVKLNSRNGFGQGCWFYVSMTRLSNVTSPDIWAFSKHILVCWLVRTVLLQSITFTSNYCVESLWTSIFNSLLEFYLRRNCLDSAKLDLWSHMTQPLSSLVKCLEIVICDTHKIREIIYCVHWRSFVSNI